MPGYLRAFKSQKPWAYDFGYDGRCMLQSPYQKLARIAKGGDSGRRDHVHRLATVSRKYCRDVRTESDLGKEAHLHLNLACFPMSIGQRLEIREAR